MLRQRFDQIGTISKREVQVLAALARSFTTPEIASGIAAKPQDS